jgi:hypothetical protein
MEYQILRRLSPEEKLGVMHGLILQAFELKAAWIRSLHPELTAEEVWVRTRELVAGESP